MLWRGEEEMGRELGDGCLFLLGEKFVKLDGPIFLHGLRSSVGDGDPER